MKTHLLFGWLFPVLLAICLQACTGTYSGRISVKGNMPCAYLALSTDKGDMKIVGALKQKLWDSCQGMRITVRGSIVSEGKGFLQPPELEVTEIISSGQ